MKGRDIKGERFKHLIAIEELPERTKDGKIVYLCKCDCGNNRKVKATELRNGKVTSCGCVHGNKRYNNFSMENPDDKRLYRIWKDMLRRCEDQRREDYTRYGARGVKVCIEWQDFNKFLEWSRNNGYSNGLSIDRVDTDGNYEPSNCRWTDNKTQANNKRNNHILTYLGKTQSMAAWASEMDISYSALRARLRRGWSTEKALTMPIRGVVK